MPAIWKDCDVILGPFCCHVAHLFGDVVKLQECNAFQAKSWFSEGVGRKTGPNRAQNTAISLGDFVVRLGSRMYLLVFFCVLIIPELLINDSGHIPIFF